MSMTQPAMWLKNETVQQLVDTLNNWTIHWTIGWYILLSEKPKGKVGHRLLFVHLPTVLLACNLSKSVFIPWFIQTSLLCHIQSSRLFCDSFFLMLYNYHSYWHFFYYLYWPCIIVLRDYYKQDHHHEHSSSFLCTTSTVHVRMSWVFIAPFRLPVVMITNKIIIMITHHHHHHHHHLHRPCEVVLRDHRAFWVARCTRCVHQHTCLVHRLVPNTFLLLKF